MQFFCLKRSVCVLQTIADVIRTCLGPRAMMKVSNIQTLDT